MATIADLSQTLSSWTRRLRLRRALIWALRGFIAGLVLSLIIALVELSQAKLLRGEFLTLVFSLSLLAPVIAGIIAFFWSIPPLKAARYFDIRFHLEERLSTALELVQQPAQVPSEMVERQLGDTIAASNRVNLRRDLPFSYKVQECVIAMLLIASLGLVWFRGEDWFKAAQQARAVQQAVAEENAQIEEIIKQVQANNQLTEEQKQAITSPLQQAQQSLQQNPSLENSVSVLTSTGEKLQALSNSQSQQMSQALQQAGNQLAGQEGSPLQSVGKDLAQGNAINAASKLSDMNLSQMSAAEQQQLANQLDAMASSLQATNPQLANQLQQAANALRNGDTAAAQQALNNAAQSLAQSGQQVIFSQTANQTASQLQQGAGQVLAAGGGQSNQTAQGSQGQGVQGQGAQGTNQSGQTTGAGGSSSGSGTDSGSNQTGNEAGSSRITQNNGPSNGGETSYEQIYAPQLLGGENGPQVNLPSSGENNGEVIGQGPTTPGDQNQSLVPYSEVYSHYEQINNQAMENNQVPPQFTQIIRNYFDSLKP